MITQRQGCIAYGIPVPQGSMKCVGGPGRRHQLVDSNKALHEWRDQVGKAALAFFTEQATSHQPLTLICHFYVPRPAIHFRTGRFAHLLKDDAPEYPTARQYGDTDKLLRAVGDALTLAGKTDDVPGLVPDDAQFVRVIGEKHFAASSLTLGLDKPGAQIEVRPHTGWQR